MQAASAPIATKTETIIQPRVSVSVVIKQIIMQPLIQITSWPIFQLFVQVVIQQFQDGNLLPLKSMMLSSSRYTRANTTGNGIRASIAIPIWTIIPYIVVLPAMSIIKQILTENIRGLMAIIITAQLAIPVIPEETAINLQ
jgi:hypothetical protein